MALDVVEFAKDLIRCPSITPVDAGVFDVLQKALEELGFTVTRKVSSAEGYEPVENLYARLGTQSPNICFAGHTDVVPVGDESKWKHPPFEPTVEGGKLYGRGAEDMKGAIASFVGAVSRMKERGEIKGSISLLITGDEEGIAINGTRKALVWLTDMGEKIDACIVGEPTNPTYIGEMVKIGRRGSLLCDLHIEGKQGHVAYPDLADNPNTRLVNMLHALKSEPIDQGNKAFPPSNLEITSIDVGNNVDNMIPGHARAKFNIRFNNEFTGETMQKWVRQKLETVEGTYHLDARVSGESFLTNHEDLIRNMIEAIKQVTGHTPKLSTTGGTSDARFIKDYAPVIEFGTTGFTPHMVNECVEVEALEQLSKVYEQFLTLMLGMDVSAEDSKPAEAAKAAAPAEPAQAPQPVEKTATPTEVAEAEVKTEEAQPAQPEPAQPAPSAPSTETPAKKPEELQATELGGKSDSTAAPTELAGKGAEEQSDTVLKGKAEQEMQATELGGKAADENL
ncbi:MAG: succinyl-diaminopimelate desuccinylase [Rickettsiales bacterium]|nr:succinyl-diaminopimelate desuccinylase [Rickettsiales bacterium]